jgi:hypothetical protein
MDLANMREQGVTQLIAFCHSDACRHQALIEVSKYPGEMLVTWFQSKIKCGKCGRNGRWINVRRTLERAAPNAGQLAIAAGRGGVNVIGKCRYYGTREDGECLALRGTRISLLPTDDIRAATRRARGRNRNGAGSNNGLPVCLRQRGCDAGNRKERCKK